MPTEVLRLADWKVIGVAGAFLAILLVWLGWRLKRWWSAVQLGARRRRGARGEARAVQLLREAGYAIVADQERAIGALCIDGRREEFDVRADLVVERDGHRLVAEVKTGAVASIACQATRRQLLEYAYVFRDLDGVLLVDMAGRRIHRVEFPGLGG